MLAVQELISLLASVILVSMLLVRYFVGIAPECATIQ